MRWGALSLLPPILVVPAGLLISYFWRPRAPQYWVLLRLRSSNPTVQTSPHWTTVPLGYSGLQLNFLPEFFSPLYFLLFTLISARIGAPIMALTVQPVVIPREIKKFSMMALVSPLLRFTSYHDLRDEKNVPVTIFNSLSPQSVDKVANCNIICLH